MQSRVDVPLHYIIVVIFIAKTHLHKTTQIITIFKIAYGKIVSQLFRQGYDQVQYVLEIS